MTTTGIKLDASTHKRLKALSEARDRTPHWLMRAAIEDFLDREENYEREKREDLARWEEYQLTGKAVTAAVAEKWLSGLAEGKIKKRPKK